MDICLPELPALNDVELSCLRRYLEELSRALAENLHEVVVFGSVARDEAWPRGMPIRSDLDLLVLTESPVSEELQERLINATLPLFLECGRQIGPQFRTRQQLRDGTDAFRTNLARDGITLYRREAIE